MQVILQEDVRNLGKAGDVVKVKDGYARNYLIPRKLAVVADSKNLAFLNHQRKMIEAKLSRRKNRAQEVARKLSELSVTIPKDVGVDERLFGAVTNKDIALALNKEGLEIDRHSILLAEPIRKIGVYDVEVRLHPEVSATVKVWVVKK